ncbi:acylphosphatase [Aquibacillus saliphilus]|uniref:acylphosphatase n=1 Tax=Aquibacillus saliphilus TaxID=1909422 RepID=UPI001CF0AD75
MLRAHLIVSGMVQGVGFRATTQQKANQIGVNGWVRNLPDGNVEIEVEGESNKVEEFIDITKNGPRRFIKVDHVEVTTFNKIKGYHSFDVKS